jgi:cysteinyl-tRNA synthetase
LWGKKLEANNLDIPKEVMDMLETREVARYNKDWELADSLRDKIIESGFNLEDTSLGQKLTFKQDESK